MTDFEFYETPRTFTKYLCSEVPIGGQCAEVCVGSGAIIDACLAAPYPRAQQWKTNDLDLRWSADFHLDAAKPELYTALGHVDWHVDNPPFTPAIEIITQCIMHAKIGVAMHLRASIHEVLKTGVRRTWMAEHTPTGILWLPRFAYQRSKTTGKWTTDSVCACWVVWLKDPKAPQFIRYAPEWVIDELDEETPEYRKRMDAIMAERKAVA